ncbi:hypothetical protein C0991_000236 [Blastosporella zonata]|nr:hypothetical protein C0991_000236 [Blastosporella zonata]
MGATTLWNRDKVAERILAGDTLIVYSGHLLKIPNSWLSQHPGGPLALLHFVGRDASDEIQAYHHDQTLKLIPRYSIGHVQLDDDGAWLPLVPPVMSGWVRSQGKWLSEATPHRDPNSQILLVHKQNSTSDHDAPDRASIEPPTSNLSLKQQTQHSLAYKALHKRVIDAGLYKTPYLTGYGPEVLRYLLLAAVSAFAYHHAWFLTSALFLGLTWHQLVFTVHDLGHMGVTHHWVVDRILSILIADYIGGLSVGWWVEASPVTMSIILL